MGEEWEAVVCVGLAAPGLSQNFHNTIWSMGPHKTLMHDIIILFKFYHLVRVVKILARSVPCEKFGMLLWKTCHCGVFCQKATVS